MNTKSTLNQMLSDNFLCLYIKYNRELLSYISGKKANYDIQIRMNETFLIIYNLINEKYKNINCNILGGFVSETSAIFSELDLVIQKHRYFFNAKYFCIKIN